MRCTRALGCVATVSQLHSRVSSAIGGGLTKQTCWQNMAAFWDLYYFRVGGESEVKRWPSGLCEEKIWFHLFYDVLVLVLSRFQWFVLDVSVPGAICWEISQRNQLLSDGSIRLDLFPTDQTVQNVDSLTNHRCCHTRKVCQRPQEIRNQSCFKVCDK